MQRTCRQPQQPPTVVGNGGNFLVKTKYGPAWVPVPAKAYVMTNGEWVEIGTTVQTTDG